MKIYKDSNITLKAKGLYFVIKTLKENNEKFTQKDLVRISDVGERALGSAMRELKENNYLTIKKENIDGIFYYEYILND